MGDIYDTINAMADSGGSYSATSASAPAPTDGGMFSGLMQQAMTLGGNYLSKRLDIDLAGRLAGNQPQPYRFSNQTPLGATVNGQDLTSRGVQAVGGMRIGDMLPFIVGGLVLWLVLGKR